MSNQKSSKATIKTKPSLNMALELEGEGCFSGLMNSKDNSEKRESAPSNISPHSSKYSKKKTSTSSEESSSNNEILASLNLKLLDLEDRVEELEKKQQQKGATSSSNFQGRKLEWNAEKRKIEIHEEGFDEDGWPITSTRSAPFGWADTSECEGVSKAGKRYKVRKGPNGEFISNTFRFGNGAA